MTIAMLALAGFPATAGFFGKIYLINAAVDNGYAWLGIVIVLGSAVSLAYYLRVVAAVWMRSPSEAPATLLARAARDRRRLARGRRRGPRRRPRAGRSRPGDPAGHRRGRLRGLRRRRAGRRRRLRQPEVVFVAVALRGGDGRVRDLSRAAVRRRPRRGRQRSSSLHLDARGFSGGANFSGAPLWGSCASPHRRSGLARVRRRARPPGGAVRRRRAGGGRTGHPARWSSRKLRLGICLVASDVCSDRGREGRRPRAVPAAVGH